MLIAYFMTVLVVPLLGLLTDDPKLVAISDEVTVIPIEGTQLICISLGGNVTWSKDGSDLFVDNDEIVDNDDILSIKEGIDKNDYFFEYDNRLYQVSFLKFCDNSLVEEKMGSYTCTVDDYNNTENSTAIYLKEKYVTIEISGNNALNCTAHGFEDANYTFTWWFHQNLISSNETDKKFSIHELKCSEFGEFTCSVKSGNADANHTKIVPNNVEILDISGTGATDDGNASLECAGTGLKRQDLNISWINESGSIVTSSDTESERGIASVLKIVNLTKDQFGSKYTCTLMNGQCSVNSTAILKNYVEEPSIEVMLNMLYENSTVYEGGSVDLICSVSARQASFKWSLDDHVLNLTTQRGCSLADDSKTTCDILSISLRNFPFADSKIFTCEVNTSLSSNKSSLPLSIHPGNTILSVQILTTTNVPGRIYLDDRDTLILDCKGVGGPLTNMSLIWMVDEVNISDSHYKDTKVTNRDGTKTIFSVLRHKPPKNSTYTCKIISDQYTKESSVEVQVQKAFRKVEMVIISEDTVSDLGVGVMFTCVAFTTSNSTKISISWIRKDETISKNSRYCIAERQFSQGIYTFKQSFLEIKSLECESAGIYTCSVTGMSVEGNLTIEHPIRLTLRSTVNIVASSEIIKAYIGQDARLVCVAHSANNTQLNFVWVSKGVRVANESSTVILQQSFFSGNRLYYMSVVHRCNDPSPLSLLDNSKFECQASGDCEASSTIDLIVLDRPQIIQIQFDLPTENCEYYIKKKSLLVKEISERIFDKLKYNERSLDDEENTVTNATLMCYEEMPTSILYRCLIHGTRNVSIGILTGILEQWIKTNPNLKFTSIQTFLSADSSCPLLINSFEDPPCQNTPTTASPSSNPLKIEVISGSVLTVIFVLGVIVAILIVILLRRKAVDAKTSAVYQYVDNYQYRMYYQQEGVYEELNDYEQIDGDKFKIEKCRAYNRMYKEKEGPDAQNGHYEPTGGDIYDIAPCVAYTSGSGKANTESNGYENAYQQIAEIHHYEGMATLMEGNQRSNENDKPENTYAAIRDESQSSSSAPDMDMHSSETENIIAESERL